MNLIVAADENWGIGREGRLLFQLSPDLKKFKARTLYGTVIMGRKTLESLPGGRPLKNRINIVLSRTLTQPQAAPAEERVLICRDLSELKSRLAALEQYPADGDVWIIGGAEVYREMLPYCKLAYVTRVQAAAAADKFFPDLAQEPGWQLKESGVPQQWEGVTFRFDIYENSRVKEL